MSALRTLWTIHEFRRLLAARFISNYGNGMAPIALSFGVLALDGAGPTDLSWVMGAQALALVLFLPFGGVWADRLSRTRVISTTDMILSGFIFAIAALFLTDTVTIPALVIINFIAGGLNALWWPAFPGLTPEVVKDTDLLQGANGAIATGSNVAMIFGAASGGLLVENFGAGYALAIDATTFLLAGILVFSIRHVSPERTKEHKQSPSMISELKEGWTTFISFRWIVVIVAAFSIIGMMLQGTIAVLGPVLMKQDYNGALSWAAVTTALSIGYLTGAVIGSKFRPRNPLAFVMGATLTASIWLFAMAAGAPLPVIAVGSFLWGFTIEIFSIFWFTAMQTHVPEESLSRVASYDAFG
jgi:MFS family permease